MTSLKKYQIESQKRELYGFCECCNKEIYVGDTIYSSCDFEYCEDCKEEFLNQYSTIAK